MPYSVSLPMYDFVELHSATRAVLGAIVTEVRKLGVDVQVGESDVSSHDALLALWGGDEMCISQSCGQPYIEVMQHSVDVLGTFLWRDVSDIHGNYRSVIVVRGDFPATQLGELGGAQPVINNPESLSGWCSLGAALSDVTSDANFVRPYLVGGGHVGSLQMLQDGIADVAAIDPATYQILSRVRPALVRGLRVIGSGPLVPATPLIVSKTHKSQLADLRAAMHTVVADPQLADEMAAIGIVGFVDLDGAEYEIVRDLIALAETVLPRSG